ncbi:MAG: hypothetical protein AAF436_19630 [Myxococcota bacterium]
MKSALSLVFLLAFAGTGCATVPCASGFVEALGLCVAEDQVPDPTCTPGCIASAHEICGGTLAEPECVCAPGYEGVPCEWGTVPNDPGFSEGGDAWVSPINARIVPSDPSPPVDPGFAELDGIVNCEGGVISQLVDMPPIEAADPFVAEVTYRGFGVNDVAFGFNRAWTRLPVMGTSADDYQWIERARICLGDAAYGGPVLFQFAASERGSACPIQGGRIEVDRFSVELAEPGECPLPGEVVNGEADDPGDESIPWIRETQGDAVADYVGEQGLSAVRIGSPDSAFGDAASMQTVVSVPLPSTLPSPALRIAWRATSDVFFQMEIGTFGGIFSTDRPLGTLRGTGADEVSTYCLAPWTHGNVIDLAFVMLGNLPGAAVELLVDSVQVVTDLRCSDATENLDPTFAAASLPRTGTISLGSTAGTFRVVADSERARTVEEEPTGFLEITYSSTAVQNIVDEWVLVPEPDDNGDPRVSFWANIPLQPSIPIRRFIGLVQDEEGDLFGAGDWGFYEACLPRTWAGRWYRVQVQVGGVGSPPETEVSPIERILIDDITVDTNASCVVDP